MGNSESKNIYQIKVSLKSIHPPIWRRILVPDRMTLLDIHHVIQKVFGWQDYHLHEFEFRDVRYGKPENDEFGDFGLQDEAKFKLNNNQLKEGSRIKYLYDFGDYWEHVLVVEKVMPLEKGMKLPQCIKGKRACPPEDVGGPGGYSSFLDAINDLQNEEHDRCLEWIGGEFDPEAFDLDAANKRLRQRSTDKWLEVISSERENVPFLMPSSFDDGQLDKLMMTENDRMVGELPLRKDVLSFLVYLQKKKVTGTQSTGNLPRKAIEEISAGFVYPPVLETKIGDVVFKYHNEDDVWPVFFVHALAVGAELISGGAGRRWRLTEAGELFLTYSAAAQVYVLFAAWWHGVNWQIAFAYDVFGGEIPAEFKQAVESVLRSLVPNEGLTIEDFVEQLMKKLRWLNYGDSQENEDIRGWLENVVEKMVIDPLENFGVLTTQREKRNERILNIEELKSFSLTTLGVVLLELISPDH